MFLRGQLPGHKYFCDFGGDTWDGLRWSARVCDASRCLKIAAKWPFSTHRVAGPNDIQVGANMEKSTRPIY